MNKEQRDQLISEVCGAMEEGKATTDDLWDAIFPTLEWCEHELKQLGFHSNYDELYEIVETANADSDFPMIPAEALKFRTTTPETDGLEHDERARIIMALRYRNGYLTPEQTPKQLLRIKDKGILSAESIVTVRCTVTHHFADESEPAIFHVNITAPASDLDLFLIPYSDNELTDLDIEILHVYQPYISNHDSNLKWLDNIKNLERDSIFYGSDEE